MILEYFEDSEEETWTRSTRNKVVIFVCVTGPHCVCMCVTVVYSRSAAVCAAVRTSGRCNAGAGASGWPRCWTRSSGRYWSALWSPASQSRAEEARAAQWHTAHHQVQTIVIHPWQRGEDVTGWLKPLHLYSFSCTRRSYDLLLHWSCNPVFILQKHWIFTSSHFSEFRQHHGLSVHLTKFHITTCCTVTFPHICMWKLTHETLCGVRIRH